MARYVLLRASCDRPSKNLSLQFGRERTGFSEPLYVLKEVRHPAGVRL